MGNGIVAVDGNTKCLVRSFDFCDKTFIDIIQINLPCFSVNPFKRTISPQAESEAVTVSMVFFSDMGVVDVPETIVFVECYEKAAVPDRDITWHDIPF